MKLIFIRTALLSWLLSVIVQCSSDQSRGVAPLQLSAKAIAADTSFLRIVTLTTDMRDVLYNNLRDARSEPKRVAMSKRVGLLLSKNDRDSLVLAIKFMGFKDVNQYLIHLSQINSAKDNLKKSGIFLEKVYLPVLIEATRLASIKLDRKYPIIFAHKTVAAKQLTKTLGTGGICYDCHYNNCDECGSGMDNEKDNDNDNQNGPGYSCRQNARATRQNDINQADAELFVGLAACVPTAIGAGFTVCGSAAATIVGAPVSPAVGVGAGCIVFVSCDAYQLYVHMCKINRAELQYSATIAGCPN